MKEVDRGCVMKMNGTKFKVSGFLFKKYMYKLPKVLKYQIRCIFSHIYC